MTADIIKLPVVRVEREGEPPIPCARCAAIDYWKTYAAQNGIGTIGWAEMMADNMLGFLWNEGFKVVPLGAGHHEYDGPSWSGEETPAP